MSNRILYEKESPHSKSMLPVFMPWDPAIGGLRDTFDNVEGGFRSFSRLRDTFDDVESTIWPKRRKTLFYVIIFIT